VLTILALVGAALIKKDKKKALRWGWLSLLGFAIASLTSQFLKSVFFNDEPRPLTYFRDTPEVLHHVPGVPLWAFNSFPSGHTITAFSIALTLLYLLSPPLPWNAGTRRRIWIGSILLFVWACSIGYSRMYLAEHFFRDVYGGAIIGVLTTMFALWLGERTIPPWGKRKVRGKVQGNAQA
jgi:membrane-associated phospholipid phosphatase